MRTKLFGPLLSLCLAATSLPLAGCDRVFSSWLRYGDNPGGDGSAGIEDLAGADLTGADLTGADMATPVICTAWPAAGSTLPWQDAFSLFTHSTTITTPIHRMALGDYNGDGFLDIGVLSSGGNGSEIKIYQQMPDCTFTQVAQQSFTTFIGNDDFVSFRNKTNSDWDFVFVDTRNNIAWCSREYVASGGNPCIGGTNTGIFLNSTLPKSIVADERGRTIAGSVLIHQKGGADQLAIIKRPPVGGPIALGVAVTTGAFEPAHAVAAALDFDPMGPPGPTAVAVGTSNNTSNYIALYDINETNNSLTPRSTLQSMTYANGTYYAYEGYVYAGRLGNNSIDDVVAINRVTSGSKFFHLFDYFQNTQPMAYLNGTNPFSGYDRDTLMLRNLDSDPTQIDELAIVTNIATTASFTAYRRQGPSALSASPGSTQSLGSAISDYSIAKLGRDHPRPDLVYIERAVSAKVLVRRANSGFNFQQ